MIGLTCSWAWSIGLVCSPPPLCVLTSLIAKGRRGAQPFSLSFFPSILSSFPLSIHSASFHWWPTCQQLLLWQAVNTLHVTKWYTFVFSTMKVSLPVQWALRGETHSLISDNVKPKLRDLSLVILCFSALNGFFLKLFALRHLVLRSVPYIRALMSQWPH